MQGWVSIHRKIMDNPVWQDPKLLKLWMLCLLEASHKEHEQLVGRKIVKLQPGQFVTGRFALAEKFNKGAKPRDKVPESTLWRWLKWLEENEFIRIESNNKFSIVTIINWKQYQNNEQQKNKYSTTISSGLEFDSYENGQQMNNKWTTNEQQMNTNNNGNNTSTTTTTIDPIQFFEMSIGRISPIQANRLIAWEKDFNGEQEIINEAIRIADDRNKRNFGFVEYLLKEWNDNNLTTLEQVKSYENNKFKTKSNVLPYKPKQDHPKGRDVPRDFELDINAGEGPNWSWKKPY